MVNVMHYLQRSDLFVGLDPSTLARVAERFRPVFFRQGDVICAEGEPGDRMFIVTSGEVVVLKLMGWGQRVLKEMKEGEIFGEMALISLEKRTATVKALTDVECLEMGQADFGDLLDQTPIFAQRVLRVLTKRLRRADEMATQDLVNAYQALIFSQARLAESRDLQTGMHLHRVRDYCSQLAGHMARHPRFHGAIYPGFSQSIDFVAPLHDIGKVGVPDRILLKPGALTPDEFEVMKKHTVIGAESLKTVLDYCDHETFRMACRIIRHHHERYDGAGYPDGLAGEGIPVEARIMALADAFDAMLSKRMYKPAFTYEEAHEQIRSGRGTQFDPLITEIMLAHIEEFDRIHRHYCGHRR